MDVLGYENGKLSVLWKKEIELDISNPQKILRINVDPVCDLDGDGKLEVMLNLYNDAGDEKWHTTVHEGMTGKIFADLCDEHLQGIVNVNGDGTDELLTVVTNGNSIPEYGTIRIWSMEGGKLKNLWEDRYAGWETWFRPMPAHINTRATFGCRGVLWRKGEKATFLAVRHPVDGGKIEISAQIWKEGGLKPVMSIKGPLIRALAFDGKGCLLVSTETNPGISTKLRVVHGMSRDLASGNVAAFHGTPTVVKKRAGHFH